jgi:ribosomal protein S18 acetylase RimI-like enzyme
MVSIRKATVTEIQTLIDFQLRLARETENLELDSTTLKKGMQAMFQDPAKGVYYVAEDGQQIVGCFMITFEWSDWRNGMVWWLQSVYVIDSYRKHGVFRLMYNHLMNVIQNDPSITGLRLYVDKTNTRAQQVYKAIGMNGEHYTLYERMKN